MKSNFYTLCDFVNKDCSLQERVRLFDEQYLTQFNDEKLMGGWISSIGPIDTEMRIVDNYGEERTVISFVSNNYLGYSKNKEVIAAGVKAIEEYGCGMGAAPCIGGFADIQKELEHQLAAFLHCEDSLVFSAGFNANCGPLLVMLRECDIALVDMYAHSSIFEGLYNTNTKYIKHNDPIYLDKTLASIDDKYRTKMVIVDGVYSQDGDIAPLAELVKVCKKHGAMLWVDDAHGIGVIGDTGRGAVEYYDVLGQVDIITGTLSKSFGSVGGFIAGSHLMINFLRFHAKPNIFSAAATPQTLVSALKSLELIKKEPQVRLKIQENASYFKEKLIEHGFDIGVSETQIVPVKVGCDQKTGKAARLLLEKGIYVAAIIYPGVKKNDARLRFGILATHTKEQLDYTINSLIEVDCMLSVRKHTNECVCNI